MSHFHNAHNAQLLTTVTIMNHNHIALSLYLSTYCDFQCSKTRGGGFNLGLSKNLASINLSTNRVEPELSKVSTHLYYCLLLLPSTK